MPTFERFPDIYARNLLRHGHGYPLYNPNPSTDMLPVYLQSGIPVGSLGIITDDGGFDFLFNACAPADDPINADGVPPDFIHFPLHRKSIRRITPQYDPGEILSSFGGRKTELGAGGGANMSPITGAGAGFELQSTNSQGAILALPSGGNRVDLRALDQLRTYAAKNAASWYKYATETLGLDLTNGSLYLVTGCDTCRSWELASFDNPQRRYSVSFKFTASLAAEGRLSLSHSSVHQRSIPIRRFTSSIENQTPFIRGFKIALRPRQSALFLGPVKLSSIVSSSISSIMAKGGRLPGSSDSLQSQSSTSSSGSSCSQGMTRTHRPFVDSDESNDEGDSSADESSDDEADSPFRVEPFHPSNLINDYLLESTESCNVAITHDEDWCALLRDKDERFPQDTELRRRLQEKYEVIVEGGAIQLRPRLPCLSRTQRQDSPQQVQFASGKGTLASSQNFSKFTLARRKNPRLKALLSSLIESGQSEFQYEPVKSGLGCRSGTDPGISRYMDGTPGALLEPSLEGRTTSDSDLFRSRILGNSRTLSSPVGSMEDILNHSASTMESRRTPKTQQIFRSIVEGREKWKDLQPKGENIWSPDLEAALLEGLEKCRPDESRETKLLGRFPARNRFIADFIYQKTGRRRTPKQVGSRLQQLRDTVGDKKLLQLFCPYWHENSMQSKATFDHLSDGLADSVGYADRTKLGLSAFNVDDFSQVEMPNKSTVERVLESEKILDEDRSARSASIIVRLSQKSMSDQEATLL
ncbi:hypothetical protein C8J56DRAFT_3537 [Mycena floridula]|nr:hypothetical protein C8J56DRAFT_3537 [Mycena floridula]